MFQLTTPLTPPPGRAGSVGVPGVGGGKGAIDLPDFMTFASTDAPLVAPGNARQDPAGGGEAVPGGAVIAPPAGHPGLDDMACGTTLALTSPIVAADASLLPRSASKASSRDDALPATAPKRARSTPLSDVPVRGGRQSDRVAAGAVNQRHTDDTDTDAEPIDPSDTLDANAPFAAAAMQTALIPLGPPTVEARAPIVGGSPDTVVPEKPGASEIEREPRQAAEPMPPSLPLSTARGSARAADAVLPLATPARDAAGRVSLGTIARMLGAPAPAVTVTTPSAYASAAAIVSSGASAPTALLPAMPASVATFLASVAPRPLAMPLSDVAPKTGQRPQSDGTAVVASPTAAAPTPQAPLAIQPAGRLFAEAIHAATGQHDRPYHASMGDIVAAPGAATAPANAATASGVTDRAPLDMTQAHWPMKMIERIEYLRDAADAQDTRIKLVPDALGAIDVSMKRDGDTMRVHLAAERPETRAMIADAQPRLAELGDQRGLKIAASNGQANGQPGSQDFHQPRGQSAPQQPARPASARGGNQPATNDDDDQRVA